MALEVERSLHNAVFKTHRRSNPVNVSPVTRSQQHPTLPNPHLPPPDCDNTALWRKVMNIEKLTKADESQYTASTHGAKRTAGYGLEMITGSKLLMLSKYCLEGPSKHFDKILDNVQKVEQYVTTFDQRTAEAFGQAFRYWYLPSPWEHCPRSEMDLVSYLSRYFFTEQLQLLNKSKYEIPCDQGAVKEKIEHRSRFHEYSVSELCQGSSSTRVIQEGHLLDISIAHILPLPAETDLRGRCDVVYGLDSRCLPFCTHFHILPCYDPSSQLCCIWLRIEYKINEDEQSRTTARLQWAIGAYLELLDRVCMYRPHDPPYLDDRPALSNIRQYGYVICGRRVEVWEMKVDVHEGSSKEQDDDETMCDGNYLLFPTQLLDTFNLAYAEGVVKFGQWHQKIMTWGLERYARDYVKTVNALMSVKTIEWRLDYAAAIGKELSPIVRYVFKNTAELIKQNSVQESREESAEPSFLVKVLKNIACDDKNQHLSSPQAITLDQYTKKGLRRCQALHGQKAKQKAKQCPNQRKKDSKYCGIHDKKN